MVNDGYRGEFQAFRIPGTSDEGLVVDLCIIYPRMNYLRTQTRTRRPILMLD